MLTTHPDYRLSIDGHTDSVGGDARNQRLGAACAAAVRDALVARRIAADRLMTASYGATHPRAGNDTLEGRAANRRLELVSTPAPGTGQR